jgi:hypothetical protein
MVTGCPDWFWYPESTPAPDWARSFVQVIKANQAALDSGAALHLTSDAVLKIIRPGLEELGYLVESGKRKDEKIRRPVVLGDRGSERSPMRSTLTTRI